MAVRSYFFNSKNGDRKYNAADIGRYLQSLVSSGVYHTASTSLQVLAEGGLQVSVQPGEAMLANHRMENDAPEYFTLAAGDTLPRYDAIVMRLDEDNRICELAVKQGTPASDPVYPAMTRTETVKEWMLAAVYVNKLATAVTQAEITDTRSDNNVCGWVHGLIDQVDTATLFLKWEAAYQQAYEATNDYLAAQQAAWEAFFASVTEDLALPVPALTDAGKGILVNAEGTGYEFAELVTAAALINALAEKVSKTGDTVAGSLDFNGRYNGLYFTDNDRKYRLTINNEGQLYLSVAQADDTWIASPLCVKPDGSMAYGGGQFLDVVRGSWTYTETACLRNAEIKDAAGTNQKTMSLSFTRK